MASNLVVSGNLDDNVSSNSVLITKCGLLMAGSDSASDFGGGTLTVQFRGADGKWYGSSQTLIAADVVAIEVTQPSEVRITLSGAGTPDLDYVIQSDMVNLIE